MRAVLQRVSRASVTVGGETAGEIGKGLLVLLGVARDDSAADVSYTLGKILGLRVFEDEAGQMNLSLADVGGALLVVSQFTLYGDVRRGRRPSWSDAAPPDVAEPLYEQFVNESRRQGARVETGIFGAMMEVELVNDGPVTILLDSRKLF